MKKIMLAMLIALSGLNFSGCRDNATEPPEKKTPVIKNFVLTYGVEWDYTSIPWNTTIMNSDTVFIVNTQEEF
ncbi:MAG: hypothetical protein LBJ23_04130, partial [Tannerella sp.]|nr:hypothetical protein [Tannerella sp.]